MSSDAIASAENPELSKAGVGPRFARYPRSWAVGLIVCLIVEVLALAVFQTPLQNIDRFAIRDSGGELVIQDLLRRGERPAVDFGYLYGLLPLLIGRAWYGIAGLSPRSFQAEVVACMILSAWGLARYATARRVGLAGVALIALAIPDLMRVANITLVQTLEQALLIHALAEQARGRRGTALALVTACCFVKPSLAFVQGLAVVIAIVAASRDRDWTAWARAFVPSAITAAVLAALLGMSFGLVPLAKTLLPTTGMAVYRLGHFGFFRGIGREFWLLPGAGIRDYFRYEVGYWMLGTIFLTWSGLAGLWRLARREMTVDRAIDDEVVATSAAVHLSFVCVLFGHRGTWFYSLPMLILGLAVLGRRGPGHRAALWLLAALLLINDRSKAVELIRSWKTDAPSAAMGNLWAGPQERAEWAQALELTHGKEPALLAMCEGAALLIPGFAPPIGAYLVPGNPLPGEVRRKAAQLAGASMIISAYPPDWPGFADLPEIRTALDGCELVMDGRYLQVYRRADATGTGRASDSEAW